MKRLAAVTLLALLLRLLRAGLRWDEICLAYAAYQQPWPEEGWLSFFGLHPPGYSLVFALLPAAPAAWLGFSALCSTLAVLLVGRVGGASAAAVLAVDPLQLAYAAEVNNYPMLVLLLAACLHEWHLRRWWGLALCGIAAGWTHLLGGFAAGLLALSWWRRPAQAGRVLAAMGLGCLPVVVCAFQLAGGEATYGQGGFSLDSLVSGLLTQPGWWVLSWPVAIVLGRKRSWFMLSLAASVFVLMALGIAASHQQPYWLVLGPPAALLLARIGWWLVPVGLLLVLPQELQAVSELRARLDQPRAIDRALERSTGGDALWLLKPALKVDDDKTAWSDVLWRFSPFASMPEWRDLPFEYVDYRYGQPRLIDGRVVHSSTDLDPAVVPDVVRAHHAAGRAVWLVLYDHGPAKDYPGLVRRVLAPFELDCEPVGSDVGLGIDELCQVLP